MDWKELNLKGQITARNSGNGGGWEESQRGDKRRRGKGDSALIPCVNTREDDLERLGRWLLKEGRLLLSVVQYFCTHCLANVHGGSGGDF